MDKYIIKGGTRLYGTANIQTSKNASLPILSASLIACAKFKINKLPHITDVDNMINIMQKLGAKCSLNGDDLEIDNTRITNAKIDCKLSKTMRSSIFLLGALLNRFGLAIISSPGGCKIGKRPIDIHIKSFKKLGVKVEQAGDQLIFDASNCKSGVIKLKLPSVGATENIVEFACTLNGKTVIKNAAREPEVVDLCNFLNLMGAKIVGAGTKTITIYGVTSLHGVEYTPIGDRIVAGTVLIATAICGGKVKIKNAKPQQNKKLIEILRLIGCKIEIDCDIITITSEGKLSAPGKIATGFYPDFPTDLQSMMLVLSCVANGRTTVTESVFENRFLTVPALQKMGANIKVISNHKLVINGVKKLYGGNFKATDLRGGAALVLAGMVADGKTRVSNISLVNRGYQQLYALLNSLGAQISYE